MHSFLFYYFYKEHCIIVGRIRHPLAYASLIQLPLATLRYATIADITFHSYSAVREPYDISRGDMLFLMCAPRISLISYLNNNENLFGYAYKAKIKIIKQFKVKFSLVMLPSKEQRIFNGFSTCIAGRNFIKRKKNKKILAGTNRKHGYFPHVRGTVMNPVDHPHGGGHKSKGGNIPRSATGLYAKGVPTNRYKNPWIYKIRVRKVFL